MVEHEYWKPIQIARNAHKLSYLAFVDDLLIFVEASNDQVDIIHNVLQFFHASSSQKISQEKT